VCDPAPLERDGIHPPHLVRVDRGSIVRRGQQRGLLLASSSSVITLWTPAAVSTWPCGPPAPSAPWTSADTSTEIPGRTAWAVPPQPRGSRGAAARPAIAASVPDSGQRAVSSAYSSAPEPRTSSAGVMSGCGQRERQPGLALRSDPHRCGCGQPAPSPAGVAASAAWASGSSMLSTATGAQRPRRPPRRCSARAPTR